jgi:crotonobetainyl-CoA:carnitine CoA-transferase CaiB-like acyl-CoA transferase
MDSRLEHVDEIGELINGFTSTFTTEDRVKRAQLSGVVCMPANYPSAVLADTDSSRESQRFVRGGDVDLTPDGRRLTDSP